MRGTSGQGQNSDSPLPPICPQVLGVFLEEHMWPGYFLIFPAARKLVSGQLPDTEAVLKFLQFTTGFGSLCYW